MTKRIYKKQPKLFSEQFLKEIHQNISRQLDYYNSRTFRTGATIVIRVPEVPRCKIKHKHYEHKQP